MREVTITLISENQSFLEAVVGHAVSIAVREPVAYMEICIKKPEGT